MGSVQEQRYKELRLGQLRAFCECVRRKSFSAAARALQISQPVVWQQVRALERQFGATLLLRNGREWEASEDGRLLFELAGSIVASVDSLQQAFAERQQAVPRTLVVAGHPGAFLEELARPVVAFSRRHPLIQTRLLSCLNFQIVEFVVTGQADAGIVQFGQVAARHPQILTEPLCQRPWALLVPADHPLAHKRRLTPADIVRYPLILDSKEFHWRQRVDELFAQAGLLDRLRVALEISSMQTARRYVSLGLGITVLPLARDGLEFPNVCVRPLKAWFPAEQVLVLWRRGATPRPQARLFIDFARQHLAQV